MSKKSDLYGAIAELFTQLQSEEDVADAKSGSSSVDAAAGAAANGKGKGKPAAEPVAAKPAAKPKAKAAPAITFEILKSKLTELVAAKGKEAAKEILSGFGAPKLTDLDEDSYGEAHSQAVAALAADEADEAADDDGDMFGD